MKDARIRWVHWSAFATLLGLVVACAAPAPSTQTPSGGPPVTSPTPLVSPGAAPYKHDYAFSADWFTNHIPVWSPILAPYRDRPGVQYLEIGLYEGRSALWVLEQILTHPTSRLTGIDLFSEPGLKERYLANLRKSGHASQAITITGYSQVELRKLPLDRYDIIYVDGSHRADDVLADAVLSWWLLKEGGLLIFDDYDWRGAMSPGESTWPPELRPRLALDAFLTTFSNSLEVVHREYQLMVRKRPNACGTSGDPCTVLDGNHLYWWAPRQLKTKNGEVLPLTKVEQLLVESIARTKTYGDVNVKIPDALRTSSDFAELQRKFGLVF